LASLDGLSRRALRTRAARSLKQCQSLKVACSVKVGGGWAVFSWPLS
jgi:hypothetical protein